MFLPTLTLPAENPDMRCSTELRFLFTFCRYVLKDFLQLVLFKLFLYTVLFVCLVHFFFLASLFLEVNVIALE